ncbi:Ig-like domain-containing protein [candidate division KSB1 bacterium]|nr:Ig-like domain-containing protein [candidate division KSB1 bacterium]
MNIQLLFPKETSQLQKVNSWQIDSVFVEIKDSGSKSVITQWLSLKDSTYEGEWQVDAGNGYQVRVECWQDNALVYAGEKSGINAGAGQTVNVKVPMTFAIQSIEVTPSSWSLEPAKTIQLHAFAVFSDNKKIEITRQVIWSIESGTAGSINNEGLFTASAVESGNVTVRASYKGNQGTAAVTVNKILVNIKIYPTNVELTNGQSRQFFCYAYYNNGDSADVSGETVWSVNPPEAGNFSGNLFTATENWTGNATVKASFDTQVDTNTIQISETRLPFPTGVTASDGTSTGYVTLSWNPVSGASYYQVYRGTDSTSNKTPISEWQIETFFNDSDANPGKTYFYWVKAAKTSSGGSASDYSKYDTGYRTQLSISISPESRPVGSESGSTTFNITSNMNWDATDDADWLTLSPTSGSGNGTLTATFSANESASSRTATITVSGAGITRQVTVIQSGFTSILTVDPESRQVDRGSGSTTFNITSNVNWSASDDAGWLSLSPASGSGNGTLTVTFSANESTNPRTATITVSGGGISRQVTVVQSGSYMLLVEPASRSVDSGTGSTTFSITSNVNWSASDDAGWLTLSPASGSGNGTLTATFSANGSTSSRTATITVSGGGITRQVTVVQSGLSTLTVNPLSRSVSSVSGSTTFNITSNVNWSTSDDADWLTLSPESGSGNETMTAAYSANVSTSPRTATITVSGGGLNRQVTVVQAGYTAVLTVDPPSRSTDSGAGSTTFSITSNVNWSASDDAGWLTLSPESGSGNGTLTAVYSANVSTSPRTATITVSGGGITRQVTVVQSGFTFTLTVDPPSRSVDSEPGSTTFNITSNVNWTASDDADWLTLNPANGSGNGTLTAAYSANESTSPRTATITVSGGGITRQVTVVQSGFATVLTVDPQSRPVDSGPGSTTFDITSNVNWSASDDADWLTLSPVSGSGNGTLTATFSANESTSSRTATITVSGDGITRQVTVEQSGLSTLTVDPLTRSVGSEAGTTTFDITSNVNWNVSDNADWLSVSPTSGSGNGTLTATYTANNSSSPRTANITVSGGGIILLVTVVQDSLSTDIVTDIDGNVYQIIKIGDQWWMAENLKVTHYRNGDPIIKVTSNSVWTGLNSGAYCYYNNNSSTADIFGALYNWFAVTDGRNIAPEGWHVPSDAEWQILTDYLGGASEAGGKMKETGTEYWNSPNSGATNESGFTALPGGFRSYLDGVFYSLRNNAHFWSSTEYDNDASWRRKLFYNSTEVSQDYVNKLFGFSIRCVKD